MNTNENASSTIINSSEIEFSSFKTIHGSITMMRLPNKVIYMEIEELTKAIGSTSNALREFIQDVPDNFFKKFFPLSIERLGVDENGMKYSETLMVIPIDIFYGFWLMEMKKGNQWAMRLVVSLTFYLVKSQFDNSTKGEEK